MTLAETTDPVRLFLVESPFQLICATEAVRVVRPDERAVLIVVKRVRHNLRNSDQIAKLLERFDWPDVRFLDLSEKSRIGRQWSIWRYLSALGKELGEPPSAVFLGEYRADVMHMFATVLAARESWLLDDGASTLRLRGDLDPGWDLADFAKPFGPVKRLGAHLLYPGKTRSPRDQKRFLFTAFHELFDDPRVVPNRFDLVSSFSFRKTGAGLQVVIGQKLSENGICSQEAELHALRRMTSDVRTRGAQAVYFAHRGDSSEKLRRIEEELGVTIYRPETPVEIEFITTDRPLASIAGFYSTALFSLRVLFPDVPVTAYRIAEHEIDDFYRPGLGEVYQALADAGISIAPDS